MLFSGGIVGRGITKINRPVARAVAKAGISKKILENPEFVKQFGYEIKKANAWQMGIRYISRYQY